MESKVKINLNRCKECGLCAVNCPKKAISFQEEINKSGYRPVKINDELCIACGICYITCPDGVYEIR